MTDKQRAYLPAAGRHWTLPLYDPFLKLVGGDAARRRLIAQAVRKTPPPSNASSPEGIFF